MLPAPERIAQGPIPVGEAISIARQIADALEAAHRDLKPANVKLRPDGTVKVLDFGLAKAMLPEQSDPARSASPTISLTAAATQMGMVVGTAAYMAPEQASGKPVDKRADVWAFGVVLYEMLTGARPFAGDDVSTTLAHVIASEPEWDALPDGLPPVVATFLRACLAKDPKSRLRDIGDLRLALGGTFDAAAGPPAEAAQPGSAPTVAAWQRPAAVAGMVAVILTGLAAWSLRQPSPGRIARFSIPLPEDQTLTAPFRPVVAVSPDGAQIVYTANRRLWLGPVDQLEATPIAGTDNAIGPFFSPDNAWIGFWADGQLQRVAVSGGAAVTIADIEDGPDGATWAADGTILYGYDGGIMRVASAGGVPEVAVPIDDLEAAHGPQRLPDGEWLLYTLRTRGPGSWGDAEIVVQSSATGERTVLFEGRDARYVVTGHLVCLLDNVIFAVPFDAATRAVTGGPVPLVEGVADAGTNGGAAHFGLSRDGMLVYLAGDVAGTGLGFSLVWVTPDGGVVPIPAPARRYGRVRISPDGTRIAAEVVDEENIDVWIWRLEQGPLTRLTFDEATDTSSLWTPDGERIVFSSQRDGGGLAERRPTGPARSSG